MDFVIIYRHTSEQEELALALARRLFAEFDEAITSLALLPSPDDTFVLTLDGELLYTATSSSGGHTLREIVGHLRQRGLFPQLPSRRRDAR